MKARKKVIEIDYYPIDTDSAENGEEFVRWVESFGDKFLDHFDLDYKNLSVIVKTLEGSSYPISSADVVIRGIKGEYYPCKKDIFEASYDYDK